MLGNEEVNDGHCDAHRVVEEAVFGSETIGIGETRMSISAQIMNIQAKPYDGTDAYKHYCIGHKDARHAAAELAADLERQLAEAKAEIEAMRVSRSNFYAWAEDRRRWLDKEMRNGGNLEHLSARFAELKYLVAKLAEYES